MDEVVDSGRFRSITQWAKMCRPKMPPSTVHAIYNSGTTAPENVTRLAHAANVNPKDVFIRIGWFDEELSDDDPDVHRLIVALATLPPELRSLAVDLAEGSIERLRGHLGQSAAQSHLRAISDQEPRSESTPWEPRL